MEPETLFEQGLNKIQRYRNWKSKLAVMAGIDPDEITTAINERDERVIHAVLREAGLQKDPAIIFETKSKQLISMFLGFATWDKRWFLVEGPAGCGKSFVTSLAVGKITTMPAGYVRVNEFTKNAPSALLRDMYGIFHPQTIKDESRRAGANGYYNYAKIKDMFTDKRGLIVLDEAYKLSIKNIEFLKDLYDETELSVVLIGASMDERISPNTLGPSLYKQIRRRINESYEIPPICDEDVKLVLTHYKVKVGARDAKIIASRLGRLGDIGTLMEALQKFARKNAKGKWSDVGAGEIMESIDEVMSKITMNFETEGEE